MTLKFFWPLLDSFDSGSAELLGNLIKGLWPVFITNVAVPRTDYFLYHIIGVLTFSS